MESKSLIKSNNNIKPFIPWVGGKSQLLPEISKYYPKDINLYCEPFVGGGAVLFDVISKCNVKDILISDINPSLINTYKVIQKDCNPLIAHLKEYEVKYNNSLEPQVIYYNARERYNIAPYDEFYSIEKAALFIFLMKTCFNGLYRVNKSGKMNTPFGHKKQISLAPKGNLEAISKALRSAEIICGTFNELSIEVNNNTFIYFDPPYRPIEKSSDFTSYSKGGFNDNDQVLLQQYICKLRKQGASVLLSNSDPKNTDVNDNFFDDLYEDFQIERVFAKRQINSNGNKRGKIREILVSA